MNSYNYDQHQKEQRRRCREAREEWEAEQALVSEAILRHFVSRIWEKMAGLESQIALSPNRTLWDTIQQLRAEVKYLDNKLISFISSKGNKDTDVY